MENNNRLVPGVVLPSGPAEGRPSVVPIPASSTFPSVRSTAPLTPLVADKGAIQRLLELLLIRGGLTVAEVSRRLGVSDNSVRQYFAGRRNRPSLFWFLKLAEVCGARVTIEFPPRGR